jgi:CRP-like cAMP-binding protein
MPPSPPETAFAFLKGSDLFEHQPETVLQAVLLQGRLEELGAGQVLFHQGDAGDRLCIVKSGVLEVVAVRDGTEAAPLAYLGEGEVVGELALLTGSPRSATVRCPQRAVVLTLDRQVFNDLLQTLPTFARDLCVVLGKRLERAAAKAPRPAGKQLQGNLRFFDLATVIQTLITAQQTGTLAVTQEAGGQKLAELFFYKGNVARARFRQLSGDDAVFQLFQSPPEGDFAFAGRAIGEEEAHSDVTLPAISLLLESVRMQDELPLLKARVGDARRPLRQKASQLKWEDPDTVELAAAVWSRLKRGVSAADLEHDIARCSYAIYRTLGAMMDAGQIE